MKILTLAFFAFFSIKTITADDVIDPMDWDNLSLISDMLSFDGKYTEGEVNGKDGPCPNPISVEVDNSLGVYVSPNEESAFPSIWVEMEDGLCIHVQDGIGGVYFPLPWYKLCRFDIDLSTYIIGYDGNEEQKASYSECSDAY